MSNSPDGIDVRFSHAIRMKILRKYIYFTLPYSFSFSCSSLSLALPLLCLSYLSFSFVCFILMLCAVHRSYLKHHVATSNTDLNYYFHWHRIEWMPNGIGRLKIKMKL